MNREILTEASPEEEGILIRLPCSVGTVVYEIGGGYVRKLVVDAFKVTDLGILVSLSEDTKFYFSGWVVLNIGKTMFFTRQEAEKALKEMLARWVNLKEVLGK